MAVRYSFVVPIFHDSYLCDSFCVAFEAALRGRLGDPGFEDQVELIFVNDGSGRQTQEDLIQVSQKFSFVRIVELSRNFGQHIAISCGYRLARGAFIGFLNADQQDPPDQIGTLLEEIETGETDIVIGLRTEPGEGYWNRVASRSFHFLLNFLTGTETPLNAASLRIMTRQFVDAYNAVGDRTPYIPGLESWLGFRRRYVPIRHQYRTQGKSSYNFGRRLRMATEAIIGFSDFPLRLAAGIGFGVTSIGMLLMLVLIVEQILSFRFLPGFTSTITAIVLLGGLNLMFLGLVSLYIGRILREVQGRPLYIVKSLHGFPQGDQRASGGERSS